MSEMTPEVIEEIEVDVEEFEDGHEDDTEESPA